MIIKIPYAQKQKSKQMEDYLLHGARTHTHNVDAIAKLAQLPNGTFMLQALSGTSNIAEDSTNPWLFPSAGWNMLQV